MENTLKQAQRCNWGSCPSITFKSRSEGSVSASKSWSEKENYRNKAHMTGLYATGDKWGFSLLLMKKQNVLVCIYFFLPQTMGTSGCCCWFYHARREKKIFQLTPAVHRLFSNMHCMKLSKRSWKALTMVITMITYHNNNLLSQD